MAAAKRQTERQTDRKSMKFSSSKCHRDAAADTLQSPKKVLLGLTRFVARFSCRQTHASTATINLKRHLVTRLVVHVHVRPGIRSALRSRQTRHKIEEEEEEE